MPDTPYTSISGTLMGPMIGDSTFHSILERMVGSAPPRSLPKTDPSNLSKYTACCVVKKAKHGLTILPSREGNTLRAPAANDKCLNPLKMGIANSA